jgi:predicted methyltransferase
MKPGSFKFNAVVAAAFAAAMLAGCTGMATGPAVDYEAIVAAPDRSEADRKTDLRRKPAQMLAFTGLRPGMKVLDLATGGGYSTELVARTVGPTGVVYGQDGPNAPPGGLKAFATRATSPAMKGVIRLVRPFDDPVPADVKDLDAITFLFEYHEMPKAGIDFARLNRRLFEILKPGGVLVVADHSALPGVGGDAGPTLHRIEEAYVRRTLEAVGFKLVEEGNFLRNPADTRDVTVFKNNVPNDEFFLKFQKPR